MLTNFSVPFVHGKGRPRFSRKNGIMRTYTPQQTLQHEKQIKNAYEGASLREHGYIAKAPEGVPVHVSIVIRRGLPKSRPKRIVSELDTRSGFDVDNCVKEVLDALNGVAYSDDKQVTEIHALKRERVRGMEDRTYVTVFWEGEEDGDAKTDA